MDIAQINRLQPEHVFVVCKNTRGSATAIGDTCCYDYTTEADGKSVITPTTAMLGTFAGIWLMVVPDDDYGLVQCFGHNIVAKVMGHASLAAGDILVPTNGQVYLSRDGASNGKSGWAIAGEAYTTESAAAKKVFLRAL